MQELVNKIMAKGSFEEADLKILMTHKDLLTRDQLVILGLAPATKAVEPVKVADEVVPEPTPMAEEPKKRGKKKSV
jgi:hypothetical protein